MIEIKNIFFGSSWPTTDGSKVSNIPETMCIFAENKHSVMMKLSNLAQSFRAEAYSLLSFVFDANWCHIDNFKTFQ